MRRTCAHLEQLSDSELDRRVSLESTGDNPFDELTDEEYLVAVALLRRSQ